MRGTFCSVSPILMKIQKKSWRALELKAAGARVLCLDCFGYTTRQQADVQNATGLETVLPRTVLIEELTALRNITPKDSADAR